MICYYHSFVSQAFTVMIKTLTEQVFVSRLQRNIPSPSAVDIIFTAGLHGLIMLFRNYQVSVKKTHKA